jgi:hypothetical protein
MGCSQFNNSLYKKPSICCCCGTFGCRNMGNLSNMPYNKSRKLLYGLLALKIPVTYIIVVNE